MVEHFAEISTAYSIVVVAALDFFCLVTERGDKERGDEINLQAVNRVTEGRR